MKVTSGRSAHWTPEQARAYAAHHVAASGVSGRQRPCVTCSATDWAAYVGAFLTGVPPAKMCCGALPLPPRISGLGSVFGLSAAGESNAASSAGPAIAPKMDDNLRQGLVEQIRRANSSRWLEVFHISSALSGALGLSAQAQSFVDRGVGGYAAEDVFRRLSAANEQTRVFFLVVYGSLGVATIGASILWIRFLKKKHLTLW